MQRIVVLLSLVLTVGCTSSLQMVKPQLQAPAPDEGFVMGSVLVTLEEPTGEEEPSWISRVFRGKWKAERCSYKFILKKKDQTSGRHHLTVKPGREEFFVTRLPGGEYEFYGVIPEGTILFGKLHILFEVKPGKTTYIGRLVARLPYRLGICANYTCTVEDAQEMCLKAVKADYPVQKEDVDKKLMMVVGDKYFFRDTTSDIPIYIHVPSK